jgi:MFS family permease
MPTIGMKRESRTIGILRAAVLLAGGIFTGMVQLAILPAMPLMAKHFAGSEGGDLIAQNITTIAAPAMALGAPAVGWLASVIGKRPVLLASMLLYGSAGALGALAPDLWTLLASRAVLGVAAAGYITMAVSLIADYYDNTARDKMIGWFTAIAGGASFGTLFVAGKLTELGSWNTPFLLYLLVFPLLVIALFAVKPPARSAVKPVAGKAGSIAGAYPIYALIAVIGISLYTISLQGVFLMNQEGITNPSVQSNVLLPLTLGTMLGAYFFGYIRPRLGFSIILAITWLAVGLGNVGFASTPNVYLLAGCAGLAGLSSGFMQPLTQTAILNRVPSEVSSRAVGLGVGCVFLGQFLNPYILAPLRTAFGLHDAFLWVGGASLVAALLSLAWPRRARGVVEETG